MKPLIYLAVPYSHEDKEVRHYRFEQANKAAGKLMSDGKKVFSPISHTHPIAEVCDLPKGWDYWSEFDKAYMSHCHKIIVLCLEGWTESKGIMAELQIAYEMGLEVEYMDWPL